VCYRGLGKSAVTPDPVEGCQPRLMRTHW